MTDWNKVRTGALVTRSPHWLKERGGDNEGQLGIVTDHKFFMGEEPGEVGVQCWPYIHWENAVMPSLTHPMNAVPVDREVTTKGKWRTKRQKRASK
jgi:hypothetical protein